MRSEQGERRRTVALVAGRSRFPPPLLYQANVKLKFKFLGGFETSANASSSLVPYLTVCLKQGVASFHVMVAFLSCGWPLTSEVGVPTSTLFSTTKLNQKRKRNVILRSTSLILVTPSSHMESNQNRDTTTDQQ